MKPIVFFYVLLVFIQSLIFGNLVRLDVTDNNPYVIQKTFIHANASLDPFLIPESSGISQNVLCRNDYFPFYYLNKFPGKNSTTLPQLFFTSCYNTAYHHDSSAPIVILIRTLRI